MTFREALAAARAADHWRDLRIMRDCEIRNPYKPAARVCWFNEWGDLAAHMHRKHGIRKYPLPDYLKS